MICLHTFILLRRSSLTSINMRAIVALCLLHAAFGVNEYSWDTTIFPSLEPQPHVCLMDEATCGCCLMQKQMKRMELFFNLSYEGLSYKLKHSEMALNNIRASRSAFSVALDHNTGCFGPFSHDKLIIYQHVFINLGDGYSAQTGIFTAPLSGVYSLAFTIYSADSTGSTTGPCADLQVNGQVVASLREHKAQDHEDSSTAVLSMKLMAGDKVAVVLLKGCLICKDMSHFNTFTGFLLYTRE